MAIPDITSGLPAIDHHSHASMARPRTILQIEKQFSTAHLETNVPPEVFDAYITARNQGDTATLERLQAEHQTETILEEGVKFRSTTFFATALREGARQLYGPGGSWDDQMLVARESAAKSPSFGYDQACRVANTPIVLADVSALDRDIWDHKRYRQVMRIDPYVYPFHDGQTTMRGMEFQRFHAGFATVLRSELRRVDMDAPPATFDQYLQFMDASIERRVREGAISLKIASAYVRGIDFEPATYADASAVYMALAAGQTVDRRAMENFLVRRACQYAADKQMPVQVHVGMGHPEPGMIVGNGAPFLLEPLLQTRSLNRLKICLLHGAYPFSSDLASLVQTYGNLYLDFSWMPYLHHAYLRSKLTEWLEILPANKLLYGSDAGAPEFHVAAASYARQALNHVLNDGVERGVWNTTQVDWLARRILYENTADIYGLEAVS
jgi:predicted TIM-barrel fold metal-dependent hydrolase